MQVFKAYFKVIKKNLPSLMIYFIIFVAISMVFFSTSGSQAADAFNPAKSQIAFISHDGDSPLVEGLKACLDSNAALVDIPDTPEQLQDALFYGKINYILTVPEGFAESFLIGNDTVTLEKKTAQMSNTSVSIDMLVNKYLNLVRMYRESLPDMPVQEAVAHVLEDLAVSVPVDMTSSGEHVKTAGLSDYFRYQAYPILAILLMGVTSIMIAFNDPELSRRNQCAPLKPFRMSLSLFAGNAVFAVAVWFLLSVLALLLYGDMRLTPGVMLLCLNALAFTVVSLSIGFLAGKFIKSPIAQAALTNVVSLGVCFLSGVFLDQAWLGETILKIASFSPGFWYIKAVNTIRDISVFSFDSIKPVLNDMLIQLAFAAACIVVALVASKQKKQNMAK
jgi:ABC-2 type transport system permease protein